MAGRDKTSRKPLTSAQRQARYRARRNVMAKAYQAEHPDVPALRHAGLDGTTSSLRHGPLRHTTPVGRLSALRNDTPESGEALSDRLDELRKLGERLTSAYVALAPRLAPAEVEVIVHKYGAWRDMFKAAAKQARPLRMVK